MYLFLDSFGFIIVLALFAFWGITLSIRYPLPMAPQDNRTTWLVRFCEKYNGAPCKKMKFFIWSSAIGTVLFTVLSAHLFHK